MEASLMATRASIPNNNYGLAACGTSKTPSTGLVSSFSGSSLQKITFQMVSLGSRDGASRIVMPVRAADSLPINKKVGVQSYASYAVPLETGASSIALRPLAEIFRDMNKRVPDKVLKVQLEDGVPLKYIPWYVEILSNVAIVRLVIVP
jgi:hypothetical protein